MQNAFPVSKIYIKVLYFKIIFLWEGLLNCWNIEQAGVEWAASPWKRRPPSISTDSTLCATDISCNT